MPLKGNTASLNQKFKTTFIGESHTKFSFSLIREILVPIRRLTPAFNLVLPGIEPNTFSLNALSVN